MKRTVLFILASLFVISTSASAAIPRNSTNPDDFVKARLGHFWVNGNPMRFVGYNLRKLTHYGYNDIAGGTTPQDRVTNLAFMKSVGARVTRAFVSLNEIDKYAVGDRLNVTLQDAAAQDVYVIVTLTDVYGVTRLYPTNDLAYHNFPGGDLCNQQWYAGGYLNNYLPLVEYLVNRFKNDPVIFCWQLGNELKCPWNWTDILPFSHDMATRIKALDSNHMVSHGTASLSFAGLTEQQGLQLYQDFDFVGVHVYNGSNAQSDVNVANLLGKPLLVSEAGMSSQIYNSTQRPAATDADIQKWVNLGARGYMNWGLMATNNNVGDGDGLYGIDKVIHSDWEAYRQVYIKWANTLKTTVSPAPEKPSNVQASDGKWPDKVEITWNKALAAKDYAVYRADVLPNDGTIMNIMPYIYGFTACGSCNSNTTVDKCFDGDILTRWCCNHATSGDHWIIFDLGSTSKVTKFVVKHASSAGDPIANNTHGYFIESGTSMNGPWTQEFFYNNGGGAAVNTLTFTTPKDLRYVRFRIMKPTLSTDWVARIQEFEIWGIPGAAKTTQISSWQTALSFFDATAVPGKNYLYSVTARNDAGDSGASTADQGYALSISPISLKQVKQSPNNTTVYVTDGIVTGRFSSRFYIETQDRTSGIAVNWTGAVNEGDAVKILGGISTSPSGERVINAVSVE